MKTDPVLKLAFRRFHYYFDKAAKAGVPDPTIMTLATADKNARPSIRAVLLKNADDKGFVFYTNLESRKGMELAENPRAAISFHWQPLKVQFIVEGSVEKVSAEEADRYWETRARLSQIGGWASQQSRPLSSMKHLLGQVARYELKFIAQKVPRPPHWSGFRVVPSRIEFWKDRAFRLHERTEYKLTDNGWKVGKLFP